MYYVIHTTATNCKVSFEGRLLLLPELITDLLLRELEEKETNKNTI